MHIGFIVYAMKKENTFFVSEGNMGIMGKVLYKRNGFSLIELMVIVAVLGVIAAVAAPSLMKYIPNWRLKNAATDLFSDLQLSRTTAIKESSTCTVTFSLSPDGYVITCDGRTIKSVALSDYKSGVKFDSVSASSVSFNPRGFADGFFSWREADQ